MRIMLAMLRAIGVAMETATFFIITDNMNAKAYPNMMGTAHATF